MLTEFFAKNLDLLFFVYGLAFVVMGIAIIAQPRRESDFALSNILWLLAGFGLSHGLNEWIDMFAIIKGHSDILNLIRLILLIVSYTFLFEFGRRFVSLEWKKFPDKWITVFLCCLVLIALFFTKGERSIWPRYLLGFPGGVLSAFGFVRYYRSNETILRPLNVRHYFFIAAFSIGIYGLLGGIVTPKGDFFPASVINTISFSNLLGVQVQAFRALCAIILGWSVWNVLGIFNWEIREKLMNSLKERIIAKAYVDNILMSMADMLIVLTPKGTIQMVNQTTINLLGYKEQELVGRPVTLIITEFTPSRLQDFIKKGFISDIEKTFLAKDGRKIPVSLSSSVMRDNVVKLTGIVCVAKDITDNKRAEEALKEAYQRAEQANQTKSDFLSTMSHELRTPLNAIIGFSEILQAKSFGPLNEKQFEYIGDISQSGKHLLSLISDILDLSKIEAGKMEIKVERFSLNELLKESTKMFAEKSLMHRIKLFLDLDNNIETIKADKRMIKQIMFNLLSNAFKFTPDKGQVGIETQENGDHKIIVTVWDSGIGISNKDKKKVFQEFIQIEHGTTRTYGGTGLGLSLCKKMVEMHGGKIWFKSEGRNKGSRFSFSLPQISSEDGGKEVPEWNI